MSIKIEEMARRYNVFDKDLKAFSDAIRLLNVTTSRVAENKVFSLHKKLDPDIDVRSIVHDPTKMLINYDHIVEIFQETAVAMPELAQCAHGSGAYADEVMRVFNDLEPEYQKDAFAACLKEAADNLFSLPASEEDLQEPDGLYIQ